MRRHTAFLVIGLIVLVMFTSSCNRTEVQYITGKVVYSEPAELSSPNDFVRSNQRNATGVRTNRSSDSMTSDSTILQENRSSIIDYSYDNLRSEDEEQKPIVTTEESVLDAKKCDDEKVIPGYHSCYRLASGNVAVVLKNQGREKMIGLWFNIEVNNKANYESIRSDIEFMGYTELVLPLNRWTEKYGSADRIIIMPEIATEQGDKTCPNRALLLQPSMSCWAMQ